MRRGSSPPRASASPQNTGACLAARVHLFVPAHRQVAPHRYLSNQLKAPLIKLFTGLLPNPERALFPAPAAGTARAAGLPRPACGGAARPAGMRSYFAPMPLCVGCNAALKVTRSRSLSCRAALARLGAYGTLVSVESQRAFCCACSGAQQFRESLWE